MSTRYFAEFPNEERMKYICPTCGKKSSVEGGHYDCLPTPQEKGCEHKRDGSIQMMLNENGSAGTRCVDCGAESSPPQSEKEEDSWEKRLGATVNIELEQAMKFGRTNQKIDFGEITGRKEIIMRDFRQTLESAIKKAKEEK